MSNKRQEMFLSRNPVLKRFTKNTIVKNFGITSEEFDKLIKDGFIEENTNDICIGCHRIWSQDNDQCIYCGEEEFGKEDGYYSYK
ncbi:hypothetical protein [Lysinibacillus sp. FSL K6-0102]|uniref:hypothetical protein n=1 Tax=Lysinibacillus sp. FSL K6-0102 TaxID=2975290 RepID=UPI0030FAB756